MSLSSYFATYRHHYATIIRLGIPLLLGQLGIIVTGYADTIMVGNYSTEALASASFANSVIAFVLMLSIGFSYGLTPLVGASYATASTNRLAATVRPAMSFTLATRNFFGTQSCHAIAVCQRVVTRLAFLP